MGGGWVDVMVFLVMLCSGGFWCVRFCWVPINWFYSLKIGIPFRQIVCHIRISIKHWFLMVLQAKTVLDIGQRIGSLLLHLQYFYLCRVGRPYFRHVISLIKSFINIPALKVKNGLIIEV